MFMDSTPDGMPVIKHRATSIQHRPSKGNGPAAESNMKLKTNLLTSGEKVATI